MNFAGEIRTQEKLGCNRAVNITLVFYLISIQDSYRESAGLNLTI
jgi:hypothetical protein